MSDKDSPSGDAGSVAAQAEAVLREAQALGAALDKAKTTRRVILLALVVIIIGTLLGFYSLYRRVRSDAYLAELRAAGLQHLQNNSEIPRQVQGFVENVRPPVEKAVIEQLKKDSPAYLQAMQAESDRFATNMQDRLQLKLDEFHDKAIMKNRALVEKEFPAASDPKVQDRLVANLHTAIENLSKKYYVDEMRKSMQDLYQHWDEIPAAKEAGKDDQSIEDQLFATLMELLKIRLSKP